MAEGSAPRFSATAGVQAFLVVLCLLSLITVQMDNFAMDPGVGWHLAAGRYVISQGEIPRVDPFLSSPQPRPWIADQWLGSTLLYALIRAGPGR
jgi:hypothetical protein